MISLNDKVKMITLHNEGKSNRQIAKELGINRKTVNKYIAEHEQAKQTLTSTQELTKEQLRKITEQITSEPEYKKRKSLPRKWNKEMDEFLDNILTAEEQKRILLRTNKQQLKKYQIHELMVEAGFDIGYTTVCTKINEKCTKSKEAFIAQSYEYGQRFEYDFGEVHVFIAGEYTKLFMAVMTCPASGYRYVRLYRSQKFDVFIDSQVRFFEHLGGCFKEGVYDNMRNVVTRFIGKGEKQLNKGLIKLALYYDFSLNVTNCYAGNEKGSVERSVDIVRNKAFATRWEFESLDEAQKYLDSVLEELNADKPIEEEKLFLSPYRPPYETAEINPKCRVDKYSCVHIDKVSYSVPDVYVGKCLLTKLYPTEVVILDKGRVVAQHARSYKESDMVLNIAHYLSTFTRKPGALANSTALKANSQLKAIFDSDYSNNPREFVSILQHFKNDTFEHALEALKTHFVPQIQTKQTRLRDPIATQTLAQIACIDAIGRSVA